MKRVPLALLLAAGAAFAQPPAPERNAATQRDYQATLQRLGLRQADLRPGVDGFNRSAPNAVNRDEAAVGTVAPLPPLLVDAAGRPVTNAGAWRRRRREIMELFDREMYGRVPATAPAIHWELERVENRQLGGVALVTRHYIGHAATSGLDQPPIDMQLTLDMPEHVQRRVPVILELGFPEGFRFPGPPRPQPPGPTGRELVLQRGWGFAVLVPWTVQADDGAGLREGVIGYATHGGPRPNDSWGALRAWAWGADRAYDLLALDPHVDARRIAIEGLSRYGKAALVAMAYDERFSLGFIGSSGAGGAKLLRRNFGETIGNLAASGEYHWFAPNFLRYDGPLRTEDLPVDAHSLIALAAPRPLFIGAGNFEEDVWVDPRGSWEAARAASPVYRLLGVPGLVGDTYPAIGETRAEGRIAFRQHEGGHTNGPNWPAFLDFAARVWAERR
ncbi:MAG: hypothetical protein JO276_08055 [Sphingomonadaceae bacterium]|nr:hypothetical protein [Sphingomonadaceae bacterium]